MPPVLPALALLMPLLLGVGLIAIHPRLRWIAPAGMLLASVAGIPLTLAGLLQPRQALHLAIGLPSGTDLALDGLSGFFLLPVFIASGVASGAALQERRQLAAPGASLLPWLAGALLLAVLAADSFALLLALGLIAMLGWALAAGGSRPVALGLALLAGACLLPAFGLLVPDDGRLAFAALRATPPAGWRAAAILLLTVPAALAQAGLAPACLPDHPARETDSVAALLAGAAPSIASYLVLRVLFDLCGGAVPAAWGLPVVALGLAAALAGGWQALRTSGIGRFLAAATIAQSGWVAIGLGLALIARGADLPAVGAQALGAALLQMLIGAVVLPLLALAAGLVQRQAGSDALDALGGLSRRMPVTLLCLLIGTAALTALPPFAGYAPGFLFFQATLAAMRAGGLPAQAGLMLLIAGLGLAAMLTLSATIRLIGVAGLGRARTPAAARAEEAPFAACLPMMLLACLALLLGFVPGLALLLTTPARRQLLGPIPVFAYGAPSVALLLAGLAGLILWWRARLPRATRNVPVWAGGFDPAQLAACQPDAAAIGAGFDPHRPIGRA